MNSDTIYEQLETDGIAVVDGLIEADSLKSMQHAFATRVKRLRWNNVDGYEKTEPFRHMVQDVLTLDQGFVDLALHPQIKQPLIRYIGEGLELTEAKGWKSLPTKKDFHGWHGDAWYDQDQLEHIPREIKLAFYLTDVTSGYFCYLKGSHRKKHPKHVSEADLAGVSDDQIAKVAGKAGTAFLFDTSGIHRQSCPILEPRDAVFYCYHDSSIPIQKEDLDYYRYHPLVLNAAFLGGLAEQDYKILGFGNKRSYQPAFERKSSFPLLQRVVNTAHHACVRVNDVRGKMGWRLTSAGRAIKRLAGKDSQGQSQGGM